MMKKRIKTGKLEKINTKTAPAPQPEPQPVSIQPAPQIDPNTFDFPVNSRFEMDNHIHRVVKAYVNDNVEMREVASEGEITVIMLKSLRKDAMSASNFTILP